MPPRMPELYLGLVDIATATGMAVIVKTTPSARNTITALPLKTAASYKETWWDYNDCWPLWLRYLGVECRWRCMSRSSPTPSLFQYWHCECQIRIKIQSTSSCIRNAQNLNALLPAPVSPSKSPDAPNCCPAAIRSLSTLLQTTSYITILASLIAPTRWIRVGRGPLSGVPHRACYWG